MVPFTNGSGLRDYHARIADALVSWPRWPWLLLAVGVLAGLIALGVWWS